MHKALIELPKWDFDWPFEGYRSYGELGIARLFESTSYSSQKFIEFGRRLQVGHFPLNFLNNYLRLFENCGTLFEHKG